MWHRTEPGFAGLGRGQARRFGPCQSRLCRSMLLAALFRKGKVMNFEDHELVVIFGKTDGHCHLCGRKLCFGNYAVVGARGAWEVDHSRPRVQGGTDYFRNLFPACITCNRGKGSRSSSGIRRSKGVRLRITGAPPKRPAEGVFASLWNDLMSGR